MRTVQEFFKDGNGIIRKEWEYIRKRRENCHLEIEKFEKDVCKIKIQKTFSAILSISKHPSQDKKQNSLKKIKKCILFIQKLPPKIPA